ncbi:MAG: alpha-amylase family glycosyl hydrolase [Gemmatimonadales bacterium]
MPEPVASWSFHYPKPDFTQPPLEITAETRERMRQRLAFLYSEEVADTWLPELERVMKVYWAHKPRDLIERERSLDRADRFTERDLILITYGDLILGTGHSPLACLAAFLEGPRLRGVFNTIHILPFFPYSSDRGFSIIDFRSVDPSLGSWQDIELIGSRYELMFDGVMNHISAESEHFQEYLNGNPRFTELVHCFRSPDELTPEQRKLIRRPRTSDILTRFETIDGPAWVWTTFSADQVDLNYKNPDVLVRTIETLLLYVRRGANILRLDAVTYLWDEPGTSSANLAQTHEIIKLIRDVLETVAPRVAIVTETHVPHEENLAYFGNGTDEAMMVYNFALPPLVLHSFYAQETTHLTAWAKRLEYPSETCTYLNMLDTHDGVGLMGVRDILPPEAIGAMVARAREHGALVSYRAVGDGSEEPYEINTTWFGALNRADQDEELDLQVRRFTASRSIALVLRGVPGVYLHGLIGTLNDPSAATLTGHARDINRQSIDENELFAARRDPESRLRHIVRRFGRLLSIRVSEPAFHPNAAQEVLDLSPSLFAVLRTSRDGERRILALTNVTDKDQRLELDVEELALPQGRFRDLVSKAELESEAGKLSVTLEPYDVAWLKSAG